MKVTFKDYHTRKLITVNIIKGEVIEYQGTEHTVTDVGKRFCRLVPIKGLPFWIYYESLFK